MTEQPLEDLLERLERERQAADRLYNDALTALDRAIQTTPRLPDAPRPYDAERVAELNASWDILPGGPPSVDRSLKGRLRGFIWRLIGPPLETQKRFNAAVVDHVNRNAAGQQESPRAVAGLLDAVRREFDRLVRFESVLVQYLQTITVYVDSKDRSLGGAELRQRLALTEQRMMALKREVEGMLSKGREPAGAGSAATCSPRDWRPLEAVDSLTYVGFEDRFRGSQPDIRSRVEEYLPMLASSSNVVDVGCGRGELLTLLHQRGITAHGVDSNHAMVELCRTAGLNVEHGDGLAYLQRQPDGSIGGLVAIQVVEHFAPEYLMRFLEVAYHKMRSGAPLLLETINPACWMAFFEAYIRDLTHQRPLHPDTLRYLVQASGFSNVDVKFRAPVTEADRLGRAPSPPPESTHAVAAMAAAINDHADKLNRRLFSSMDYVVVARR